MESFVFEGVWGWGVGEVGVEFDSLHGPPFSKFLDLTLISVGGSIYVGHGIIINIQLNKFWSDTLQCMGLEEPPTHHDKGTLNRELISTGHYVRCILLIQKRLSSELLRCALCIVAYPHRKVP